MTYFQQPTVRAICAALEEAPGAMRDEPFPEDVDEGHDPASEITIWEPDGSWSTIEFPGVPPDSESGEGMSDEPAVIFEVPPSVTDVDILRVMGEERIGALQQLTQIRGIDALGWYVTFHQRKFQSGIHIPVEGVLWLVVNVLQAVELDVRRKIELAFHAILRHELFHFAADCMTANWELATGTAVYWSSRGHRNEAGYIELEEGLANAYMLRGFKHPSRLLASAPGVYAALKRFCERQPDGYRDGPQYVKSRGSYLRECRYLSYNYHQVSAAAWHVPHAFDTVLLYPDPTRIDWSRCPIIVIDDRELLEQLGTSISYFRSVPDLYETAKFQRALVKLDRRLQELWLMTKRDLARSTSLKSLDFKQWKQGGNDCYSVRVKGSFRAHLRYDRNQAVWFAEAIGDHKAMGHG